MWKVEGRGTTGAEDGCLLCGSAPLLATYPALSIVLFGLWLSTEASEAITIAAETDRIYTNVVGPVTLRGVAGEHSVTVTASSVDASEPSSLRPVDTVVWNPWVRWLTDAGGERWRFVVVHRACAVVRAHVWRVELSRYVSFGTRPCFTTTSPDCEGESDGRLWR